MQGYLSECSLWFSTKAVHQHNKKKYALNIYIHDKSLRFSYLQIKEDGQLNFALLPLKSTVLFSVTDDSIHLSFLDYGSVSCVFDFQIPTELELIVSHMSKATILENTIPDQFLAENVAYMKQISADSLPLVRKSTSLATSVLTPINSTATARTLWQDNLLKINSQFYLQATEVRFSFLTWNVAGHRPQEDVLADIVRCFKVPTAPSDIIIIAFQEIDMSVKSVVTGNSNLSDKWTDIVTVAQQLFGESKFELIANESCGSVYCAALARKDMLPTPVVGEIQQIKLGAGGIFANKAAILIPIKIGEAKIMAVACHLAPHEPNMEERNEQWRLIAKTVGDDVDFFSMMGDMNYRITLDFDSVVEKAQSDQIEELLEHDQLKNSQKKCKILERFKEAEIHFRPTYKFDKNCDVYDTSPKHRIPSYTDRVLIKVGQPRIAVGCEDIIEFETDISIHMMENHDNIQTDLFLPRSTRILNFPQAPQCICYRSLRCTFSDHRPVHAAYKYIVPVVNEARLSQLKEIIEAKFQELVVVSVPKISLDPPQLDYKGQKSIEVRITNNSMVWANWSLRKAPHGVSVSPNSGRLYALQSKTFSITFEDDFVPNDPIMFDLLGSRAVNFKIYCDDEYSFPLKK